MGESVGSLLIMVCILWVTVEAIAGLLSAPIKRRILMAAWIAFTIPAIVLVLGAIYGMGKGLPIWQTLAMGVVMLIGFGLFVWLLYGLRLRIGDWTENLLNRVRAK